MRYKSAIVAPFLRQPNYWNGTPISSSDTSLDVHLRLLFYLSFLDVISALCHLYVSVSDHFRFVLSCTVFQSLVWFSSLRSKKSPTEHREKGNETKILK